MDKKGLEPWDIVEKVERITEIVTPDMGYSGEFIQIVEEIYDWLDNQY